jgi:hypothetical protein
MEFAPTGNVFVGANPVFALRSEDQFTSSFTQEMPKLY